MTDREKKEIEEKFLAHKLGLELSKTDERTVDQKLQDLDTRMEDFKCMEADLEVQRIIADSKKQGGTDKAMFEQPKERKFEWDDLGC